MSKAENVIAAEPRQVFGDNASRRLRKAGTIPAIIYGCGKTPQPIQMKAEEWQVASARGSQLYTISIDGKSIPTLVKEVQFNHLKNYVYHVDFQEVDVNAEIHSTVPIHAIGEAKGAAHGGVLEQEIHQLPVICRPADLPEMIKVDVTALDFGDELKVADLALPEGVRAHVDADTVVFHVVRAAEEVEAPAATEGEAAAEPEAINEKKTEARAAEKESKDNAKK